MTNRGGTKIISQILKAANRVNVGNDGDSGVTQTKKMHKHFSAMSKLYFKGMLLLSEYDTFKNQNAIVILDGRVIPQMQFLFPKLNRTIITNILAISWSFSGDGFNRILGRP
jgi:hypothetical protein